MDCFLVNVMNTRFIQYLSPIMHYKLHTNHTENVGYKNCICRQPCSRNELKKIAQSMISKKYAPIFHSMCLYVCTVNSTVYTMSSGLSQVVDLLNYVEHFMVILLSVKCSFYLLGLLSVGFFFCVCFQY